MKIHEYQAKQLFRKYGIPVPEGEPAFDANRAVEIARGLIEKTGTWYSYKGERLGQGRENVKKLLQENTELAGQLDKEIRQMVGLLPGEKKEGKEKPPKQD